MDADPAPLPVLLKFLILLCRPYILGDEFLPHGEDFRGGACGVQPVHNRPRITFEVGKRQ
jgi:hypothetical protein